MKNLGDVTLNTDFLKKMSITTCMFIKDDSKYLCVNGLPPPNINKIKIDKSNIHGNGVFSSSPIKEGDVITCYPCEWVRKKGTNMTLTDANNKNIVPCEKYAFEVDDVMIYGNPNKHHNMSVVGHIINDPCPENVIEYIRTSNNTYENILKYYFESDKQVNSKFIKIGCYVAVVALKNIAPNEEILAHYNYLYWRTYEKNDDECDKENEKFKKDMLNLNDKQKNVLANLIRKYVC
jgi:SET domain-containing protein